MLSTEIRYFIAVASNGSLSAASLRLFVAVSAISRQIQRLEERVGVPLFERHARGMTLNDAGRILENHVRKSMKDMDEAIAEIQGLRDNRPTLLRVAGTEGMAFDTLPAMFARFQQNYPETSFHFKVGTSQQVSQMVRNGEVDIAVQFSLAPEHGVDVLLSLPAPFLLLMSDEHPLANTEITLVDLKEFSLALPDPTATLRQLFDISCHINGAFLEPTMCCNSFTALYGYILNNPLALTACSYYSVMYRVLRDPVRLKKLDIKQLEHRQLQLLTQPSRSRSTPQEKFIEFLVEELNGGDPSLQQLRTL